MSSNRPRTDNTRLCRASVFLASRAFLKGLHEQPLKEERRGNLFSFFQSSVSHCQKAPYGEATCSHFQIRHSGPDQLLRQLNIMLFVETFPPSVGTDRKISMDKL